MKYLYFYDDDQIIYRDEYFTLNGEFEYSGKRYYEYYDDGRLKKWFSTIFTDDVYENYQMEEHFYDTEENSESVIVSSWSHWQEKWESHHKRKYFYKSNNRFLREEWYHLHNDNSDLINRKEFIYDENENLISIEQNHLQIIDEEEIWKKHRLTLFTEYDTYGNFLRQEQYLWSEDDEEYGLTEFTEANYDYEVLYDNLVYPYGYEGSWKIWIHRPRYFVTYVDDQEMIITFYYSDQVISGLSHNVDKGINVYPNPTTDILNLENNVDYSFVRFYNAHGEKIYDSETTAMMDISFLKPGIYFMELCNEDFTNKQTLKIVKE